MQAPEAADAVDLAQSTLFSRLPVTNAIILVALVVAGIAKLSTPAWDSSEPPLLKPRIPIIGHLIGIIRFQSNYHRILSDKNPSKACVTLPILNGKLYGIYDPHLVQQVLRAKVASFDPFQQEFAQKVFGLEQHVYEKVLEPTMIPAFTDAIHQSFQKDALYQMNSEWLAELSLKMDPISNLRPVLDADNAGKEKLISGGIEVENFYLWCRDLMSYATTRALYGEHNPFAKDKALLNDIWLFEESVPYFLLSLAPSVTMPRAYKARKRLQDAMIHFYDQGYDQSDPSVSTLARNRAGCLRSKGWTGREIAFPEIILPVVSTLNAVPTLFWLLLHILRDPALIARIRSELLSFAVVSQDSTDGRRDVIMDITNFETELPLLVSCYRETMRITNHSVSNRRMMNDLAITTQDGRSYMLKKGVDVQLPAGVTHRESSVWGTEPNTFIPDRFVPSTAKASQEDRARKAAYIPFGGGRHLCPGRNFAFAEIIGMAAVVVLGFDVEATGKGFAGLKMRDPSLASGTVKPVKEGKGLGARIRVREGWEGVRWRFKC